MGSFLVGYPVGLFPVNFCHCYWFWRRSVGRVRPIGVGRRSANFG